ncbi:Uncharacterised protein [uncultured archaeon]|nr:Uncharacterised protein [uncultured archaeon]
MNLPQNIRLQKDGRIQYAMQRREIGVLAIDLKDTGAIFKNRKNSERLESVLGPVVKKVAETHRDGLNAEQTNTVVSNAAYLIQKRKASKFDSMVRLETDKGEALEAVKAPSRLEAFVRSPFKFKSAWQNARLHYAFQIEQTIKLLIDDAAGY